MRANIVWDSTFTLAPPFVNSLALGTTSEVVRKSPGPELPISNAMIGMDLFVILSMAKTNAEKEYQSFGT